MANQKNIPTILFYGDPDQAVTPDLLHCEALSLRSKQHQFKIGPHRHHGLNQIFYLKKGSGIAYLDGEANPVKAPCLISIAEMCVHHFDWSESIEGKVISVATALLLRLGGKLGQENLTILSNLVMQIKENGRELEYILDLLFMEYHKTSDEARDYSLNSLVHLLGIWIERNAEKDGNTAAPLNKAAYYLKRFNQLVNKDFQQHRKLESYARELGITEPHLNSLCQQHLGKNAQQILHERIILEAKRQLTYTVQSVSQIAYELGFNDPAYFSRFFKRMTASTPKTYRRDTTINSWVTSTD